MPRRTNMKNTKQSLMPQCPVKVTNILWTCVLSSCYSCYALVLHLQTLESGSSRSFMPVEQSVVWKGDISRGTMWIIPGLYVTVADNAANKYLIPNHLAINPILVSSLPIHIHMIISTLHGHLFGSSLAYSSINIIITMINPILIYPLHTSIWSIFLPEYYLQQNHQGLP